jgi:hypothetical protein
MSKFYTLIIVLAGLSGQTFAQPPECPLFKNKQDCMRSVKSNFDKTRQYLDEIMDEEDPTKMEELILASLDVQKYETLACQKTCLN